MSVLFFSCKLDDNFHGYFQSPRFPRQWMNKNFNVYKVHTLLWWLLICSLGTNYPLEHLIIIKELPKNIPGPFIH